MLRCTARGSKEIFSSRPKGLHRTMPQQWHCCKKFQPFVVFGCLPHSLRNMPSESTGQRQNIHPFRTVCTNLLIERPGLLRLVEGKNHLDDNSLASMRWIKPPHKWPPKQTMVFAPLHVNDANTANKLIKEGLYIDQHLVRVKKDKKEPIRCAKCQQFGHIARNCNVARDICETCTGNHRTTDCHAYKTVRCTNCRKNDHASWSRSCPEFE